MKTVPLMFKRCVVCDCLFIPTSHSNVVCSPECAKKRIEMNAAVAAERRRQKEWRRIAEKSLEDIMQIEREAWKLGISYGKYVARMSQEGG